MLLKIDGCEIEASHAPVKRLNFIINGTMNYKDLQEQTLDEVSNEISNGEYCEIFYSCSREKETDETINLSQFIRDPGDVFLSHSLADRNYLFIRSGHDVLLQGFETILVPGSWTRRRVLEDPRLEIDPSRVFSVGHPRIDFLLREQRNRSKLPPLENGRLRILFAPAHTNHTQGKKGPVSSDPAFLGYCEELGEIHDLTVIRHPKERRAIGDSKSATVAELIDCDVVITDVSSIMFEAWALGKPVVFPRWLLGDSVINRYPGSAEAHIHTHRIGYHADNFEELCRILENGPEISIEVHRFMDEYLGPSDGISSSKRVCAILERCVDPASLDAFKREERVVRDVQTCLPAKAVVPAPANSARVSIQLLQQSLLNADYGFFKSVVNSITVGNNLSKRVTTDILILELEAALHQSNFVGVTKLIGQLAKYDLGMSQTFSARVTMCEGKTLDALELVLSAIQNGVRSYAAWRLIPIGLFRLGRKTEAFGFFAKLAKHHLTENLLYDVFTMADTEAHYNFFQDLLRQAQKSIGSHIDIEMLGKTVAIDRVDVETARATALACLRVPTNVTQSVYEGYGPRSGLPSMVLQFEKLSESALASPSPRRLESFNRLCHVILANDLPLFLSSRTLRAFINNELEQSLPETIELGINNSEDVNAVCEEFQRLAYLDPLPSFTTPKRRVFQALNGVQIVILIHYKGNLRQSEVHSDGVVITIPPVALRVQTIGGHTAPVPKRSKPYLSALFEEGDVMGGNALPPSSGGKQILTDNDDYLKRLYFDFASAVKRKDDQSIAQFAKAIRLLGDPTPEFEFVKMTDNYLCEDLSEHMQEAHYILHIGDGVDATFHIDLWLPYVQNVDPNCLLAIRSKPLFNLLRKTRPELNAIYIKSGIEAEWIVQSSPNLVGILYVSNTGSTVHFLRFNHLTHIWLGHGDSEKAASCHKFFRAYDEVWCAGRAQVDRFHNADMNNDSTHFRIVGRPTLRDLITDSKSHTKTHRFLYLPTWEGFQAEQGYSSIQDSPDFVPMVADMTQSLGLVKFHPWAGKRITSYGTVETQLSEIPLGENHSIEVLERTFPAADLMAETDFLISDISSVVSDYLAVGKPIFLFIPQGRPLRTTTSSIPFEEYCYIFKNSSELAGLVRRVINEKDDFLEEKRRQAQQYFLDVGRTLNGGFEAALKDLKEEHSMPNHAWSPETPLVARTELPIRSKIIAHRGDRANYPENSLSGYRATAQMSKLDGVELDVHFTSDGKMVVMHDPMVDRTTTGSGPIVNFSLEEIQALNLKTRLNGIDNIHNEHVPTLEEVLDLFVGSDLELYIEIKNDALGDAYAGIARPVLQAVAARNLQNQTILTSFSPNVLEEIRHLDPDVPLLASVNYRSIEMLGGIDKTMKVFDRIPGCAITLERTLTAKLRKARGEDFDFSRFGIWVVNDSELIAQAVENGNRQIFTDDPVKAIEIRDLQGATTAKLAE